MNGYIDLFVLPVPKNRLKRYCKISTQFGKLFKSLGALNYREFVGEDISKGKNGNAPFQKIIKLKKGEVLVSAAIEFKSKSQRNKINEMVRKDKRAMEIIKKASKDMEAMDMKRTYYGGFETIVNP